LRFTILGAGAIGGYVGASLARGGADVTLIARGEHLRALQEHGVRVETAAGDFTVKPPATDDVAAVSEADVVFIGLKAYSLPAMASHVGKSLGPGTAVIAGQNGIPWWYFQGHRGPLKDAVLESVDPGGGIASAIDHDRVIGCVVYCSTEIVVPGVIRHIEGTRFSIGEPDGHKSDRCAAISDAFVAGGLKCPVESRLRDQIWLKLIGNAAFNPITTLAGTTLGAISSSAAGRQLARTIMEEGVRIAGALDVKLPVSIDRRLDAALAVGDHKTSMLQDYEAGKPLETDCMTGAMIEIAERLGIDVPYTRTLHSLVQMLEDLRGAVD
jgi:2-dehydropantoate 2-reductase